MRRLTSIALILIPAYFIICYLVLPRFWVHYEHRPELEALSKTSFTHEGRPGDPLNIALLGTEEELTKALELAGWKKADALGISSDLRITKDVLLHRPYPQAPVSRLYLFSRPQDLAFEKEVGSTPAHRHHVRFWKTEIVENGPRVLWVGSATYDRSVGFSKYTGQITHHIAADVDTERNALIQDIVSAKQLTKIYQVSGVGPLLQGRNGGGDRYFTDGEITVGIIPHGNKPAAEAVKLSSPPLVEAKNNLWAFLRGLIQSLNSHKMN